MRAFDVEDTVALFINIYKWLVDADKLHHERAIIDPSYPYKKNQKAFEKNVATIVKNTNKLLDYCSLFEKKGYKIKDKEKLISWKNAFANTDKLFEEFYCSRDFEAIHQRAVAEYKEGKTEVWP